MIVTPLYAGLLGLLLLALSIRVIARRRSLHIGLGDGGDRGLLRLQRAQANLAEYAPMVLLLMALSETGHQPAWVLHAIGVPLLIGRAVHAYGFGREPEVRGCRVVGMALTLWSLGLASLVALWIALPWVTAAGS